MKVSYNDFEPNEVIRIIREWTGLNQTDFGKKIGKSLRTIQGYEAGTTKYNSDTLKIICQKFKVEIIVTKK